MFFTHCSAANEGCSCKVMQKRRGSNGGILAVVDLFVQCERTHDEWDEPLFK